MPEKQQKIIGYMSALYEVMSNDATKIDHETHGEILVWQGRLIETCTSVGIPQGYYKRVVDTMRVLGCVEVLSRGRRGTTLTAVVLRYPPTQELYEEAIVKSSWERLTSAPSLDTLAAQVRDLGKALGGINIVDAFKTQDERFQKIETALDVLQQQVDALQQEQNKQ